MIRYDAASWSEPYTGNVPPGMQRLHEWIEQYDPEGTDAGICSNRPVRGGSAPSLHRDCRAKDHNFSTYQELDVCKMLVVGNAEKLNVQRFTDYGRGLSWDCRLGGDGWGIFTGVGSKYNPPVLERNVHIERNEQGASDPRPIDQILGLGKYRPVQEDDDMLLYVKVTGGKSSAPLYVSDGIHIRHLGADEVNAWRALAKNTPDKPIVLKAKDARHLKVVGAQNQNTIDFDGTLNE
jgi:hypothetical protein